MIVPNTGRQAIVIYTFFQPDGTLTIRLYSNGFNLYSIGVQGFIISNSAINNLKLKNILLYTPFGNTVTGFINGVVYSYPGVILTPFNTFFGLYYLYSFNTSLSYTFTFTANGSVSLYKVDSNPAYFAVYILITFRNYCTDPFSYDETSQSCIMCMPHCDSCDAPECLQCAINFTLAADKLSCFCSDQEVSDICYAFNFSNMKGCVSATVDSSNIITCMMCSIT